MDKRDEIRQAVVDEDVARSNELLRIIRERVGKKNERGETFEDKFRVESVA